MDLKSALDDGERTALHLAAGENHCNAVAALVECGVNVNEQMGNGCTALHLAAENNCISCIDVLLNVNADVSIPNREGETPLHIALAHDSCRAVLHLLRKFGTMNFDDATDPIRAKTLLEATPLHYGARKGCMEWIKNLLEAGAEATARNINGQTPLHYSAKARHRTATALLSDSINVNDLDYQRQSALHFIAHCGAYDVAAMLLQRNIDVNVKDLRAKSPLQVAIEQQHENVVQLLLEGGANVGEGELSMAKQLNNGDIMRVIDQAHEEQSTLHTFTINSATKTIDWQSKLQILSHLSRGVYGEVNKALFRYGRVLLFP